MYDGHQTSIEWDTRSENQIVVSWFNEGIKTIEIDKISLNKSAKEMFVSLMEQYRN